MIKQLIKTWRRRKVVAHWEKMIAWAEKQPKHFYCDAYEMLEKLGETWGSEYCEYCKTYIYCFECPLGKDYSCGLPESLYDKVSESKTWGEWVENARKFLVILKKV
jgi:hypothetical protein